MQRFSFVLAVYLTPVLGIAAAGQVPDGSDKRPDRGSEGGGSGVADDQTDKPATEGGSEEEDDKAWEKHLQEHANSFKKVRPPFAAAIGKASKVSLLEGLPHPKAEPETFQAEKKNKKSTDLSGHAFYEELLPLTDDDAKKITSLLTADASFAPYRGGKFCGGFHPDYAVQFQVDKDVYRALICFGCAEAMLVSPHGEVTCEINADAYASLGKVLKPCHKNRPRPRWFLDLFKDFSDKLP